MPHTPISSALCGTFTVITADGLNPVPGISEAVRCMLPPTDKEGVHRFLGFVTYLSKFIPFYAPLRPITKNYLEFSWEPAQQQAFEKLKHLCTNHPVLKLYDVTKPMEIYADASSTGLGAVLVKDNLPVAFSCHMSQYTMSQYTVCHNICHNIQ